jgi:hypothetical protein
VKDQRNIHRNSLNGSLIYAKVKKALIDKMREEKKIIIKINANL